MSTEWKWTTSQWQSGGAPAVENGSSRVLSAHAHLQLFLDIFLPYCIVRPFIACAKSAAYCCVPQCIEPLARKLNLSAERDVSDSRGHLAC